jgi:hypothetical protein
MNAPGHNYLPDLAARIKAEHGAATLRKMSELQSELDDIDARP